MPETCTDIAAEAILPGGGCHGLVSLCLSSSFAWRNVCNHSALEDLAELLSTCNLTMAISIDRWRLPWSCFSAQIRGRGDSPLASLCHQMHCIWYMCDISFSNMDNAYGISRKMLYCMDHALIISSAMCENRRLPAGQLARLPHSDTGGHASLPRRCVYFYHPIF